MRSLRNSWLLFFLVSFGAVAQTGGDTTLLNAGAFLGLVKENHPMVLQARLARDRADAERLKASGNFDPKLFNETRQKYFDDKTYFRLQDAGVQIPAWYGLSAKTGYEQNSGIFLNDQNNVPSAGLWYADLSLTVGRGLFIDERRAMLKQARLMQEAADFEIQWALNQLYQEALQDYWEWYRSYTVFELYKDGVELAQQRFSIVRQNALIGEEPFIDTLEAYIQYQTRLLSRQKAEVAYNYASRRLETYLWLDGLVPLELAPTTLPFYQYEVPIPDLNEAWLEEHPQLQFYSLKIDQLDIEQRLNREQLKPQLDLNYKFLNEPVAGDDFFSEYAPGNYQWGLSASFPLFLRKERAAIRKTNVKLRDTRYERQFKQRDLQNKVEALRLELDLTLSQLNETRSMVENYQGLLQAEIIKFENGESSLFLINQREIKFLESSEKQLELQAKLNQVLAKLEATAGVLAE